MRLQFADDRIKEYFEGGLHFKNDFEHDGHGFTVSDAVAGSLLKRTHELDGEQKPVFIVSEAQGEDVPDTFPENFPSADKLTNAGFTFEGTKALTRDQLLEIKGIGEASADAILEALGE